MTRSGTLLACAAALSPTLTSGAPVQRYALVAGANQGGATRAPLLYAVSDAERFARVLVELGGVVAADLILLRQPGARELDEALSALQTRVNEGRRAGAARTEVLVYYSGHADDQGLLLGEERYSYRRLRDHFDELPADVKIGVLDACASGAFTRLKGGRVRPPFLIDESADMRGHAFLTSSAESEAAQESDRIGGSYFTHYLISGLRGGADASGEGKVTLNEAYQFAFNETLGRTVDTKGGAQHPSYDINLSGTGDVVITDLRQTSAVLVLAEALEGRFFVHNARHELVVELSKAYGRRIELGLEPGRYEVRVEREAASLLAHTDVADGARVVLEPAQFSPTPPERTRARGGSTLALAVAGRNRLDLRLGTWDVQEGSPVNVAGAGSDLLLGIRYTRFLQENLAVSVGFESGPSSVGSVTTYGYSFDGASAVVAIPIELRWNPMRAAPSRALKPYLLLGMGPVIGSQSGASSSSAGAVAGPRSAASLSGSLGAGVDAHLGRSVSVGVDAGYRWMADFPEPIAAHRNYGGFVAAFNVGWLFGKGTSNRR